MILLRLEELLHVADRTLGGPPGVRDVGLLEAAVARPQASAFGQDAYPTLELKAAALVHSIARHHAPVDGNKRLALAGLIAMLGLNGRVLTLTNDEAYDVIIDIATGALDDIPAIADRIAAASRDRWIS